MSRPASRAEDDGVPDPAPAWEVVVGAIGPRIRDLRHASGLSLQQLARRADVSAAAIHKVERTDMVPTITTLLKLATALNRPLSHFVADPVDVGPLAVVTRAGEGPALAALPGVRRSRIDGDPGRLHGEVVEIEPGAAHEPGAVVGEDVVVVLDGTLELTIGAEHHTLGGGDAVRYPTDHPVRWSNTGDSSARAVRVAASPVTTS